MCILDRYIYTFFFCYIQSFYGLNFIAFSIQQGDMAIEILNQGGFNIKTEWEPNKTYDNLDAHKWKIEQ